MTSTTTSTHTVDTTAAEGTVTVDDITDDDVINATEAAGTVTVTGTATGGDISEGDTVSMTINGTDYTTTVDANGEWSVDVDGSDLADDTSFDVEVTSEDDAGNEVTSTTTSTHTVDTTAAEGTVTVDDITDDDVINATEAAGTVTVTGTATGGDISEGDTVSMTINGTDYTTTVDANGEWSVDVDGSDLADDTSFDVEVTSEDDAGNEVTSTTTSTHTVDTTAPAAPSVELTHDTGSSGTDLITNDGTLTVTPNETGNTIEYSTNGGTTWSTTPPSATEGSNTVTVREIDPAGNPSAPASITFTLDTTAPTITLDEISDNYINALESGEDLIISGTTDAEDGQSVVVNFNGTDYTATVTAGVFSVTVPAADVATLSDGTTYTATATVSDVAGNTATDTEDVIVDTTPPTVTEELPEDSINDTGASDSDNITYNGTPTLSGTTEPDSEVTVTIPNAPSGDLVYTTTADSSGNWSISINGQLVDGAHTPTVTATDPAGNTTTITGETFTVDTNEPVINIDTTLEGDNVINASEQADVTISGTIGDGNSWTNIEDGQIVTVTLSDGVTTLTTTATVSGNTWTATDVDVSSLTDGNITVTADVTDVAGNAAVTATTTLVKDTTAPDIDQLKITNIVDHFGDYSSVTMYGTWRRGR